MIDYFSLLIDNLKLSETSKFVDKHFDSSLEEFKKRNRKDEYNKLSIYQKVLIYHYTNSGYESLNEGLRNKSNKPFVCTYKKLLNNALDGVISYQGTVYRKVDLTKSQIKIYTDASRTDSVIEELAFVSTTKDDKIAKGSFFSGNAFFTILSKNGKDIEQLSCHGLDDLYNEKEVLFKSNTKFKVLSYIKRDNYTFTLEEV